MKPPKTWRGQAVLVIVAFFALLALGYLPQVLTGNWEDIPPATTSNNLPACEFEDGAGQDAPCYWDAAARGNRKGAPVVNNKDQRR